MKNIAEAVDSIFAELASPWKFSEKQAVAIRIELDNALRESEEKISDIIQSKNGSSRILGYVAKQNNGAIRKA